MAFKTSGHVAGANGGSFSVTIPATIAVDDIFTMEVYNEVTAAITFPSGFAAKLPDLSTTAVSRGRIAVFWIRATSAHVAAAGTGTWAFSWTGSTWREGNWSLHDGRITTGDPWDAVGSIEGSANATTSVNPGLTTSVAGCDLVGFATSVAGGTWSPPSLMTERQDGAGFDTTLDTQDNVAQGATGPKTFTCTGSGVMKSWLGALLPASGATATPPELVMAYRQF